MCKYLDYLNSLIDKGFEFADAIYKTSEKFKLNSEQVSNLELDYDNQFIGGQ